MSAARELTLRTQTRAESRILCGRGIAEEALKFSGRTLAIVDENAARLHPEFLGNLRACAEVEILPSGESSKNFANVERFVNLLAERRYSRSDRVLAVGGGVTTDLSGFVAATFMRGIGYCSLPTTLLGMVDAAIGGKCGVDLPAGKNLAGAFYQPALVAAELGFLDTLPKREVENGLGEIIKYGVIADASLFDRFSSNTEQIVFRCMELKCEVVAADERESGRRMLLNFGHTVGHAIEKLGGFSKFSHGAAVANGMIVESRMLEHAGFARREDTALIEEYVDKFHLRIPENFSADALFDGMASDKKRRGDILNFAGFTRIGAGKVYRFSMEEAKKLLKESI